MRSSSRIDAGDLVLIRSVDSALAEAATKSGTWLACRPGCTECCLGPFPISQLDARRLRRGLAELEGNDPEKAGRLRGRARQYVGRIAVEYPNQPATAVLAGEWGCDEPCPALDPESGTCDLYSARPMMCRAFGPAVRCDDGTLGVCELCYQGATDAEIAACEVEIDPDGLESALDSEWEAVSGRSGQTLVAAALAE